MSNNEEILFYFSKFKCCYMYVLILEGTSHAVQIV
jgi:hypothetical protein